MSTTFHPQTDGQTERWNTEIEQYLYLRAFIDYRQTDWVKHLPITEFALNNWAHSATGHSPFYLLYGYHPLLHCDTNPFTTVPVANDRLEELQKVQADTQAALSATAEKMKFFYNKHIHNTLEFSVGQKVWLDTRNLLIKQPSCKLSHK